MYWFICDRNTLEKERLFTENDIISVFQQFYINNSTDLNIFPNFPPITLFAMHPPHIVMVNNFVANDNVVSVRVITVDCCLNNLIIVVDRQWESWHDGTQHAGSLATGSNVAEHYLPESVRASQFPPRKEWLWSF